MDKFTEKQISTTLDKMENGEEGLDRAYDDTVNRIENQEQGIRELAKKVLFWIVHAKRPLTTEELRVALAVEPGTSRLDERNLCPVEDLLSSCAGLVVIDSKIIRLVHYTTQEYFQRYGLKSFEGIQRDIIATSCLTYLSYDVSEEGRYLTDRIWNSSLQSDFFKYTARNWDYHIQCTQRILGNLALKLPMYQGDFFEYAARNWAYHIQDTQQNVRDLALKFLMDDRKTSAASQVLLDCSLQQFCGMHLVAYFGLNDIMVRLLEEKNPDTKDSVGRTPLSYAVEMGNARLVELLLGYNVDLHSKCTAEWTPFSRAIEGGSAAVVQIFLTKGVKIDNR